MKNALFLLALLVAGCFSCKGKHTHDQSAEDVGITPVNETAAATPLAAQLDSSMVNLKTFSSVSLETLLCQKWAFEDADREHWNEIFWDSLRDTRQYPELQLFPDHSVVLNPRCGLKTGNWSLNKELRQVSLHFKDGSSQAYAIRQMSLKKLELGWQQADGLALIRLKSDGIIEKDPSRDPYYPANNVWRQKPAAAETTAQLKKRVRDCIHFYALYFTDNHNRQAREIAFDGLPGCFEWYNGGIGMQSKVSLDPRWINCFYSERQAMDAYEMIGRELDRHELKWPEHPRSWVEQTGQVLVQLTNKF